jgi:hypothetical protein
MRHANILGTIGRTPVVRLNRLALGAWRNGRLKAMLDSTGTEFDRSADVDSHAFLPRWLQPR